MSIHINAKADVTYLFASLGSGAANVAGSNFLGQYASIKNGSYAKLMKAYYNGSANESVKSIAGNTVKKNGGMLTAEEAEAITKVQKSTDALKESADALLVKGSKSVFAQKEIHTTDENGVETVSRGYDTEAVYKAVNQFVEDYNAVLDAAEKAEDKSVQNRTVNMARASVQNEKLLGKVGISIGEDGRLSLNKEALSKADMSTVKALFQDNGSYAWQVSAQASLINFAADQAASRANTYTVNGTFNAAFNSGNIFNTWF